MREKPWDCKDYDTGTELYRTLFVALYDRYFNFNKDYGINCDFIGQYVDWFIWYNR